MSTGKHDDAPIVIEDATSPGSATSDSLMKGELPRLSDAQPEVVKSIIKLDGRSMVWAHDQAASDVEAMTPFMASIMVLFFLFGAPMFLRMDYAGIENLALRVFLFCHWRGVHTEFTGGRMVCVDAGIRAVCRYSFQPTHAQGLYAGR